MCREDFDAMAERLGIQPRIAYTLPLLSRITGTPYSTLAAAAHDGRLRSVLPEGRQRGRLVRPEWYEEWLGA